MGSLLEDTVDWRELSEVEKKYHSEIRNGNLTTETKFHYAQKLVKSQYQADILKGIKILEDVLGKELHNIDVDEVYLSLALGYGRLGDFKNGLFYLRLSSSSCQGREELEAELLERLHRNGWIGVGIVAGATLLTAVLITYVYKKSKS
eukprot:TRINITY_DN9945_c0_g1_i1.p1 TRINITY_DN9945_c0_g1~~TRINITY_DN9945_c0_g1_i1.p1  ORF type:complete len:148 (+),score=14.07 TRINITY_DN9945_c0_g1_i1:141-584(+)